VTKQAGVVQTPVQHRCPVVGAAHLSGVASGPQAFVRIGAVHGELIDLQFTDAQPAYGRAIRRGSPCRTAFS
jgi:hypothetical protein